MDTVRFFAANTQPNPVEVDYWVDLYDNPYGGSIKYYNGTEWVRLAASGGIPDLSKYYTKVQVNQLLNDKASVQSVESKVDDEEVKDVIKNITFRTSNPNEVQMVLAKYDTTTVAISLPKASDVSAGIVTSDDFKDFVKQVDFQQLYQELYDSNSNIMNAINDIKAKYQKKLIAGSNIEISDDNVISAIISIEGGDIDVDGINSKIDELTGKLQEEVTRSTNADNELTRDLSTESTTARAAEKKNADNIASNTQAIQKEVTDRNAAIEVEKQRALKAEAALDSKIATHTNEINTALATKADKSTTYNKTEVDSKVSTINQTKQDKLTAGSGIKIENNTISSTLDVQLYKIVDSLPTQDVEPSKIYLVLSETSTESNKYTEYVYVNNKWEIIGSYTANVDLSGYLTKTDAASTYQPKGNYALKTEIPDVSTKADTSYVNTQIQTVNTEINKKANKADLHAVATSGNYNDLTNKLKAGSGVTITDDNTINTSVDLSGVTDSISELDSKIEAEISRATIAESNKVDKIVGKGLSTNDYTTNEKNKLAGIASGAEVNVQSDWNQTDINSDDYIKNKPVAATTSKDGFMSAADKTKLDGIAEGANAYTLPAATAQTLGGVKIGSNISLADGGVISINKTNVTTALGYTPLESVDTSNFVTLSGTQTIAGKKTFSDIICFNQQIQGNALSASKLQTARQINGTDFNGSANITTSKWGTSRNLTIGKTAKAVDGSSNISWLTSEIADNATTTTDGWMSKEDKLALANLNSDFYGKEQVTVSVKKDGVAHSVQIDIKNKDNDEVIATSTGSSLTTRIVYGVKYYVSVPDIDKYTISAESLEYTASQQMRTINLEYTMYDEITIDQTVTDPNSMISGDVNGTVLQWIRNNTHRYVAKKTGNEQVTICQLSDNDTTKFYDNLTSSSAYIRSINHGVFVRIPRFWYKATETSTNIWKIGFSNRQQNSTWKEWDGNDLIGAYEGVVNGSQLLSISGEPSTSSVSQIDFKSYARTNGVGYTLVKWKHYCIVGVLYYALYGNTNCQATIGSGTNSYTKNTGLTNSLGMNDSSASATGNSGSINFLGLENWWGNKYEFIDNVTFNHGGTDYKFYIVEDDGSSREVQAHQYTGTFYPTVMVFGEHLDLVMKPNTTSGTTSTGFCDSQYFSEISNQVVRRSCNNSGADGGVACLYASGSASGTSTYVGSRLAFRGTIIEEKDIETFKAL